jgi:tetratricopeptide (TPR) repeat protein
MEKGKIYRDGEREVRDVPNFVMELFFDKKYGECLSACEKVLEEDPKNDFALFYMGAVYREFKEYDKAITCLYRFTLRVPEFYSAWKIKGICELRSKKYDEAKRSFLELAKLNGKSGVSWGYLAFSLHLLRERELAFYYLGEGEKFATEDKEEISYVRSEILADTDPNAAILYLHKLESSEKDETKKREYAERVYKLVIKKADPLRRSGLR